MIINKINIYIASAIFLLFASIFSLGYHQYDEHFQILEFAGLKLQLTSAEDLPWEFHNQMRPAIQPLIVYVTHCFMGLFGEVNPFHLAFVLRLISAALSFLAMWLIYKTFSNKITNPVLSKWFLILSFTLWFLIFRSVRFSSENWSGLIFTIAFALYFIKVNKNVWYYLFLGTILGLSFIFRYQVGFLVFGFISWLIIIQREKLKNLFALISGIFIVICLGVLIDKWFYGEWTLTSWNYFTKNIIENKVSEFGVDPWWYYLKLFFIQAIPPFSLLFLIGLIVIIIFKRRSAIVWCIVPFLVIHFIIGHKELRFLYPLTGFIPFITIKSLDIITTRFFNKLLNNKGFLIFMKIFFIANTIPLIIISFKPSDSRISLYQTIYNNYNTPTILYCVEDNPYKRAYDIHFYKRSNLEVYKINSLEEIDKNAKGQHKLILFKNDSVPSEIEKKYTLVYTSYPDILKKLHLDNLIKIKGARCVFDLDKPLKSGY